MKGTLLDLLMPIITPRLILRPPQIGDGAMLNEAVLETFDLLHLVMPWAKTRPSVEESEENVRQAAANWILKNDAEPYLQIFIFDKNNGNFIGGTRSYQLGCPMFGNWLLDQKSNRVNPLSGQPSDTLVYVRHNIDGLPDL